MDWLQDLADWPVATALRRSSIAYLLVNASHIVSFGLLVGSIATLDMRMLGLFRNTPLGALGPILSRVAAAGLLLSIATGLVLFTVRPIAYAENPAFLAKLGLVGFGAANALLLQRSPDWRLALEGGTIRPSVRVAAFASLVVWIAAVLAGRWIGFL